MKTSIVALVLAIFGTADAGKYPSVSVRTVKECDFTLILRLLTFVMHNALCFNTSNAQCFNSLFVFFS